MHSGVWRANYCANAQKNIEGKEVQGIALHTDSEWQRLCMYFGGQNIQYCSKHCVFRTEDVKKMALCWRAILRRHALENSVDATKEA